jgi:hypothetical protein
VTVTFALLLIKRLDFLSLQLIHIEWYLARPIITRLISAILILEINTEMQLIQENKIGKGKRMRNKERKRKENGSRSNNNKKLKGSNSSSNRRSKKDRKGGKEDSNNSSNSSSNNSSSSNSSSTTNSSSSSSSSRAIRLLSLITYLGTMECLGRYLTNHSSRITIRMGITSNTVTTTSHHLQPLLIKIHLILKCSRTLLLLLNSLFLILTLEVRRLKLTLVSSITLIKFSMTNPLNSWIPLTISTQCNLLLTFQLISDLSEILRILLGWLNNRVRMNHKDLHLHPSQLLKSSLLLKLRISIVRSKTTQKYSNPQPV